jgi:hypothetical protein
VNKGIVRFKADFVNDRLWTHTEPDGPFTYTDETTGKTWAVRDRPNEVCVVTGEHFLRSPLEPQPQLGRIPKPGRLYGRGTRLAEAFVQGLPPEGGRVIHRYQRAADKGPFAWWLGRQHPFHPKVFFAMPGSEDYLYESWRMWTDWVEKMGPEERSQTLGLFRVAMEDGHWVLRQSSRADPEEETIWKFDMTPARNCVEFTLRVSRGLFLSTTAHYTTRDGIAFPEQFIEKHYGDNGDALTMVRKFLLVSTEFNVPLAEKDFDYGALGAVDGTRLIDYAPGERLGGGEILVYRQGEWLSVADYNAAYLRDQE